MNCSLPTCRSTWFTTLLGLATILLGGLGSLFSLFLLLLAIGKPYATSSSTATDIFLLYILPPTTLLAGIGLLLRWRWARWWMIILMTAVVVLGVKHSITQSSGKALNPSNARPSTEAGIRVKFLHIGIGASVLAGLFWPSVRREFQPSPPQHP